MRQETFTIDGPRDFELDRDRVHPLTFTITWPDVLPAPGLTLLIGGCGGEAETAEGAHRNIREHIVSNTGMAAISVDYHAQQNRPFSGGSLTIATPEHLQLIGLAALAGLKLDDYTDLVALSRAVAHAGAVRNIRAKIRPNHGELQNFGVTQAMDHLTVVGYLLEHHPLFDSTQIFVLGGSHGGYIGHLMAKMAPGVLAALLDNSGYVLPPIGYLGFGDEHEYAAEYNGIWLKCQVEGTWSFNNRYDPTFYDRNRDLIRDVAYPPHVEIMGRAGATGATVVSMFHCEADELTPPREKMRQAALLRAHDIPTKLHVVQSDEIDGVIFKDFVHNMAASLKRLFVRDLPQIRDMGARGSGRWGGTVEYPCVDRGYRFGLLNHSPYVTGEVFDLFPAPAEQPSDPPMAATAN